MVGELPLKLRRMGEDLVLFRDRSGTLGLLHLLCAHRNASLEFGIIEQHGIRCCYHGWLFGTDGAILETPGEPKTSQICERVDPGSYPVIEYKRRVRLFRPIAAMPQFPVFDTMELPDDLMVPYLVPSPANWVQVFENSIDPITSRFCTPGSAACSSRRTVNLPVVDYHERAAGNGVFYTSRAGWTTWCGSGCTTTCCRISRRTAACMSRATSPPISSAPG